jgi:hypothetical protein
MEAVMPIVELIAAYDEYIVLLAEQEKNLAIFAYNHGYKTPDEVVVRGKELRQKIEELKTVVLAKAGV